MPVIDVSERLITQINVFTVQPENQERLIELLKEAAHYVSDVPGWVSASLHRSLDGRQVVNYAQCRNYTAQEAVMDKLRKGGFFERNSRLGVAHPCLYEVAYTLDK
ncbi:MAG TPA: antibiotic biosynthesis monooxygenase family protein [Rickettsiales bacterium]|nr:antibiotic biosynthesis monooxygenase family protein [Rickettsiales bacterium]